MGLPRSGKEAESLVWFETSLEYIVLLKNILASMHYKPFLLLCFTK
jgi:hypothetical protein